MQTNHSTTSDSPLSLTDLLGWMSELPSLPRELLFVTPKGMHELRKFSPARTAWQTAVPLDAIDIRVVPELKKRVPKSLDRFAEYDERDMDWAVPAGLAKWVEVDVDAMMMRVRDTIEQKFLMGLM